MSIMVKECVMHKYCRHWIAAFFLITVSSPVRADQDEARTLVNKAVKAMGGEEKLAKFKCPKQVRFADTLPKSPVGKIIRKELRKLV